MYTIREHTYSIIRDRAPAMECNALADLFHDSHTIFKIRIQKLGNIAHVTTDEDSEILRIMLDTLISTKKHLQIAVK